MVTDSTVGMATGIAATRSTRQNSSVVRTGSPRKSATTRINTDQRHCEDDQVVADLQYGALEMADGVSLLHQLRGLAEVRVRAGRIHHGVDLALTENRARKHRAAGFDGDGQGFSCQRRLIHFDWIARQQARVRGYDVAQTQTDDVAGHQTTCLRIGPLAISLDACIDQLSLALSAAMALPA
jgi:hypothetical protein